MAERPPMAPARFDECLALTRRSVRGYAKEIGAGGIATVRAWRLGTSPVPPAVEHHLETDVRLMAELRGRNPPPEPARWRRNRWWRRQAERPEK